VPGAAPCSWGKTKKKTKLKTKLAEERIMIPKKGILAATMALAMRATAAEPVPAAPKKPNVIFILADDWGYGDVKCLGGDRCKIETPNMDKLAGEGMIFTNAQRR
jgi:hypothetical protein